MKRAFHGLVAAGTVAALAACGGGSSGSGTTPALPAASPAAQARVPASGSLTLTIPNPASAAASAGRRAEWISPSTLSVDVSVSRADGWNEYNPASLSPTGPNCTVTSGGRTCTVPYYAPPTSAGNLDKVVVYLWDSAQAQFGDPLATATATNVTVTSGAANALAMTLGGIVGTPPVLTKSVSVTNGTAKTIPIFVAVTDCATCATLGTPLTNPIVGLLDAPLTLTLSDPHFSFVAPGPVGSTSVSLPTIPAAGTAAVTVQYNGGTVTGTPTITAVTTSNDTKINFSDGVNPLSGSLNLIP